MLICPLSRDKGNPLGGHQFAFMILEDGNFVCLECGYSIPLAESEEEENETSKQLFESQSESSDQSSEQITL